MALPVIDAYFDDNNFLINVYWKHLCNSPFTNNDANDAIASIRVDKNKKLKLKSFKITRSRALVSGAGGESVFTDENLIHKPASIPLLAIFNVDDSDKSGVLQTGNSGIPLITSGTGKFIFLSKYPINSSFAITGGGSAGMSLIDDNIVNPVQFEFENCKNKFINILFGKNWIDGNAYPYRYSYASMQTELGVTINSIIDYAKLTVTGEFV